MFLFLKSISIVISLFSLVRIRSCVFNFIFVFLLRNWRGDRAHPRKCRKAWKRQADFRLKDSFFRFPILRLPDGLHKEALRPFPEKDRVFSCGGNFFAELAHKIIPFVILQLNYTPRNGYSPYTFLLLSVAKYVFNANASCQGKFCSHYFKIFKDSS